MRMDVRSTMIHPIKPRRLPGVSSYVFQHQDTMSSTLPSPPAQELSNRTGERLCHISRIRSVQKPTSSAVVVRNGLMPMEMENSPLPKNTQSNFLQPRTKTCLWLWNSSRKPNLIARSLHISHMFFGRMVALSNQKNIRLECDQKTLPFKMVSTIT